MKNSKTNKKKANTEEIIARKSIPQRETIKRRTIDYMKELGIYKKEYNQLVEVYSDLLFQYNYLTREFENRQFEVIVETEKSSGKKSPILASLETLRKDILLYSDRLMLNAKAQKEEDSAKTKSKKASSFASLLNNSGV